jgi:transposase
VIGPTGAVRVLVATKPVDFRKGAEGLAVLVREEMKVDPFSGAVYVLRAKRADRVKLIFWTARASVCSPSDLKTAHSAGRTCRTAVMHLTAVQLSALLEGLDWRRVHAARETAAPAQPN